MIGITSALLIQAASIPTSSLRVYESLSRSITYLFPLDFLVSRHFLSVYIVVILLHFYTFSEPIAKLQLTTLLSISSIYQRSHASSLTFAFLISCTLSLGLPREREHYLSKCLPSPDTDSISADAGGYLRLFMLIVSADCAVSRTFPISMTCPAYVWCRRNWSILVLVFETLSSATS